IDIMRLDGFSVRAFLSLPVRSDPMTKLSYLTLALSFFVSSTANFAGSQSARSGTILIGGGTVVDGSGRAKFRADVRIVGDKIAEIGELSPRPGERVITATGLVVCPGFIDTHSHADSGILENLTADVMVRQGITTAIGGQDGSSPHPLSDFFG